MVLDQMFRGIDSLAASAPDPEWWAKVEQVLSRARSNYPRIVKLITEGGEAVQERAREIARKLAAKSPIVMKIGRDAFMRAVDADFRRAVENAAESFALVATTEDCQEGLNAFVEKRTPNYKGR